MATAIPIAIQLMADKTLKDNIEFISDDIVIDTPKEKFRMFLERVYTPLSLTDFFLQASTSGKDAVIAKMKCLGLVGICVRVE